MEFTSFQDDAVTIIRGRYPAILSTIAVRGHGVSKHYPGKDIAFDVPAYPDKGTRCIGLQATQTPQDLMASAGGPFLRSQGILSFSGDDERCCLPGRLRDGGEAIISSSRRKERLA